MEIIRRTRHSVRSTRYWSAGVCAVLLFNVIPSANAAGAAVGAPGSGGAIARGARSAGVAPGVETRGDVVRKDLRPGSRHQLFVNGHIAVPLPRMASDVKLAVQPNGSALLRFAATYVVTNTQKRNHVRPDRAVIDLTVGPGTGAPVYRSVTTDKKLNQRITKHSYELKIPKKQVKYLNRMGLNSKKKAKRQAALTGVKIEIHQERDFKVVDGKYDWKQGLGFNAATKNLRAAGNEPAIYITVTNSTGNGIYNYVPPPSLEIAPGGSYEDTYRQVSGASGPPITVVTSGAAVSCVYNVGNVDGSSGSNPQGFNTTLNAGQSATNFVITNTKDSGNPASSADLQGVSASTLNYVQYGLKVTAATVGGFLAPVLSGLAWGLWYVNKMTSCNSFPTVMNLSAYTQDGLGAISTNWNLGYESDGLANIYSTPWNTTDWYTNQVQLAPDTGVTYNGQPLWLTEAEMGPNSAANCGTTSGSVTCNNEITLAWSTSAPCPYTDGVIVNGGRQGGVGDCFLAPPTSPEVTGCGSQNSGCIAYGEANGTEFVSSLSGGPCLNVPGASTTPGTQMIIYSCNGTAAQLFNNTPEGIYPGAGLIQMTGSMAGLCLDTANAGSTAVGTAVISNTCNAGYLSQQWVNNANGTITNPNSGLCLDVSGGNPANGTGVDIYTCNGTNAQIWTRTTP